jgi:hypothetical protein
MHFRERHAGAYAGFRLKQPVIQLETVAAPEPARSGHVVGRRIRSYLQSRRHPSMREPSVPQTYAPRPTSIARPFVWAGAATFAAVGVTGWLWAHYGAAVFFETIRAGFAACFG